MWIEQKDGLTHVFGELLVFAGWSKDYKQEAKQTLLSENIVFYRCADGSPVARKMPPHRKLPLSHGQLKESWFVGIMG